MNSASSFSHRHASALRQRNPVLRQSYEELVATQNSLGAAYATWWPVINQSINGGQYGARSYYNYPGAFSGGVPTPGAYRDQKAFIGSYFQFSRID